LVPAPARLLNAPAPVQALGLPYLQMLALALLLDAYNASMSSVMRAHLRTRDAMFNILAMHACTCCCACR